MLRPQGIISKQEGHYPLTNFYADYYLSFDKIFDLPKQASFLKAFLSNHCRILENILGNLSSFAAMTYSPKEQQGKKREAKICFTLSYSTRYIN